MSPTLDAFLRSWPFDPWLLAGLGLTAGIYLRGWLALRRRNPQRWHAGQLSAFLGGLAVIYLALASPIEPFAALSVASPHAPALAAHDGRAAASLAGSAAVPVASGPSAAGTHVLGRAPACVPRAPSVLCAADPPGGGAASFCRDHLAVARAGGLRARPALQRLALSPARLFPCHRAAVLVSGRPALSQPPALVTLASVALLDPGGRAKHRPVGPADFLQPGPVSPLSPSPAAGTALRLGGSIRGRRPHVGARFLGFSLAPVRDRLPASVRPESQDAASRGAARG